MIDREEVLQIHRLLIAEFGGMEGVREEGLLDAALQRPFAGFGETEFYPSAEEKAAALLESIAKNHPFVDGNKRTAYVLMRLMLLENGKDLVASQDEKYDFVVEVTSGKVNFEQIVTWIRGKLRE
jgi:death-on-curing protein